MDDKTKILLGLVTTVVGAILVTAVSPYGEKLKNIISSPTPRDTRIILATDDKDVLLYHIKDEL